MKKRIDQSNNKYSKKYFIYLFLENNCKSTNTSPTISPKVDI